MKLLILTTQRLAILGLGALSIWLILPYAVRMGLKILRHQRVPRYTVTGDGLPGDPVNLALVGTFDELRAAFASAGWPEANPLGVVSSRRMVQAFVLNRPYPTAPSQRSTCSDAARTSAFSCLSATARASGIMCASGPRP